MYWSDQARIQKLPRVKVLPGRGLPIFGKFYRSLKLGGGANLPDFSASDAHGDVLSRPSWT